MQRIGEVAKKYWPMVKQGEDSETMIRFMIGDEVRDVPDRHKFKVQLIFNRFLTHFSTNLT